MAAVKESIDTRRGTVRVSFLRITNGPALNRATKQPPEIDSTAAKDPPKRCLGGLFYKVKWL